MLSLCFGHRPSPIAMSCNSLYYPETLINEAERYEKMGQQLTLKVGEQHFPLRTPSELALAASAVASYHNQYVSKIDATHYWEEEVA